MTSKKEYKGSENSLKEESQKLLWGLIASVYGFVKFSFIISTIEAAFFFWQLL